MPSTDVFRLSVTRALADQLAEGLARLTPSPLRAEKIAALEARAGIYQLYEDIEFVYVGKAERSLRNRLTKHYRKLIGRENVGAMEFTCLYVDEDLHVVAPEKLLISRYRKEGKARWNHNGFGNNDPGRERDTTAFEADHFDSLHPARLDWLCDQIIAGDYVAAKLLARLKSSLPYNFRYQSASFHNNIHVEVPESGLPADRLFEIIGHAIAEHDARWQITALPGYVIMYPSQGPYPSARKVYQ